MNRFPSSTLLCRPIKFVFAKEDKNRILLEYNSIQAKIENLECDIFAQNGEAAEVSYVMHCTMIDGAVGNVLTNTNSTSRCFLCNACPTEMNNVEVKRSANPDHYKFGLSILHSWIRFFECLIHIAYRLPFKTWQVREENKTKFMENKTRIQREFKSRMGLRVDEVKQGFGTTNDGNTARRFFSEVDIAADITKLDKDLIFNFSLILRVLSCSKPIENDKFSVLLKDTATLYISNYPWYYMPSSVHKVLIHGCDVIKFFDLPIGKYFHDNRCMFLCVFINSNYILY